MFLPVRGKTGIFHGKTVLAKMVLPGVRNHPGKTVFARYKKTNASS
jgi:hypothetical protein